MAAFDPELSLTRLLDPEVLADPYPLYARLREEAPVYFDPFLHTWVVTRYADVLKVLLTFSADRTPSPKQLSAIGMSAIGPIAQVMVKQMLFLDPPAHTRLRSLAATVFSPRRVKVLEEHIRAIAHDLIDKVLAGGRMNVMSDIAEPLPAIVTAELLGVPVEDHDQLKDWSKDFAEMLGNYQHNSDRNVMSDIAEPLPAIVTAELLGVPVEDHDQLKDWSKDFAEMLGNYQHNPNRIPRVLKSTEEMTKYFRARIGEEKDAPREGLIQSLLSAEI